MTPITRLVVIDAHPLAYRAYHSPGTRNLQTSTGVRSGLFYGFLRTYLALRKRLPNSHFVFCFDSAGSWRNTLCSEYKTQGDDGKPDAFVSQLTHLHGFLTFVGIPHFREPMLEADDLISVLASEWVKGAQDRSAIIVSSDRDFFQIVSDKILQYDDRAKKFYGPKEVENLTGVKIQYFLSYKCLMGDKADRLSGVYGYGPKRARMACRNPEQVLFGPDLQIFTRNKLLIKLPRTAEELHLHTQDRRRIRLLFRDLFIAFNRGLWPLLTAVDYAQDSLDYYECRVFKATDFLYTATKPTQE